MSMVSFLLSIASSFKKSKYYQGMQKPICIILLLDPLLNMVMSEGSKIWIQQRLISYGEKKEKKSSWKDLRSDKNKIWRKRYNTGFRFQEKNLNLNRDSNLGSPGSGSNFSLEI